MSVMLYTSPSCTSCRKAKRWFKEHQIDFTEQNIFVQPPSVKQIKLILQLSENGTEDIISTRSKDYEKLSLDIDNLSIGSLIKLINRHPGLLRRPIMFDNKRLQVGFNDDEIRRFLPREVRTRELEVAKRQANLL